MFDLVARRKLNRGHDDGFSRAVEIVVTPLLFGLLGRAIDGWLGTRPVVMIALGAFGAIGIFVKIWIGYDRQMRAEQAAVPARRGVVVTPAPVEPDTSIIVPRGTSDTTGTTGTTGSTPGVAT